MAPSRATQPPLASKLGWLLARDGDQRDEDPEPRDDQQQRPDPAERLVCADRGDLAAGDRSSAARAGRRAVAGARCCRTARRPGCHGSRPRRPPGRLCRCHTTAGTRPARARLRRAQTPESHTESDRAPSSADHQSAAGGLKRQPPPGTPCPKRCTRTSDTPGAPTTLRGHMPPSNIVSAASSVSHGPSSSVSETASPLSPGGSRIR